MTLTLAQQLGLAPLTPSAPVQDLSSQLGTAPAATLGSVQGSRFNYAELEQQLRANPVHVATTISGALSVLEQVSNCTRTYTELCTPTGSSAVDITISSNVLYEIVNTLERIVNTIREDYLQ